MVLSHKDLIFWIYTSSFMRTQFSSDLVLKEDFSFLQSFPQVLPACCPCPPLYCPSTEEVAPVCRLLRGENSFSPPEGLIGVKRAAVKSHQRPGTLVETGRLLLGGLPPTAWLSTSLSVPLSLPTHPHSKNSHCPSFSHLLSSSLTQQQTSS